MHLTDSYIYFAQLNTGPVMIKNSAPVDSSGAGFAAPTRPRELDVFGVLYVHCEG
jgi:hypothetical protein